MKKDDSFNRTLGILDKFKYFLGAWLLSQLFVDSVYKFLVIMHHKRIVTLPESFTGVELIWGNGLGLNILKTIILVFAAILFSITYYYLCRKVKASDKVSVSFANAFLTVFSFTVIYIFITAFSSGDYTMRDTLHMVLTNIGENPFTATFVILDLILVGIVTFSAATIAKNYVSDLPEERGKLLGIKWYHFIWLAPAIGTYIQAFLGLIYLSLHIIDQALSKFNFFSFFFSSDNSGTGTNLVALLTSLVFMYIVAVGIFNLILVQRNALLTESQMPLFKKIGISLVIALVIPALLIIFTFIGNNQSV